MLIYEGHVKIKNIHKLLLRPNIYNDILGLGDEKTIKILHMDTEKNLF